jgi:hypothetical protein
MLGHGERSLLPDALLELTAVAGRDARATESFVSVLGKALSLRGARVPFRADEWRRVQAPDACARAVLARFAGASAEAPK